MQQLHVHSSGFVFGFVVLRDSGKGGHKDASEWCPSSSYHWQLTALVWVSEREALNKHL